MVTYRSIKVNDGCGHQPVYKVEGGRATVLSPKPSQEIWNHSPDGFNFSYGGSGPAQLALAILYDVTGDKELSVRLHQDFKWQVVAGWGDKWEISSEEIEQWVKKNAPAHPTLST